MGRKPRISLENRGKVLVLLDEGYLQREVTHGVGCSQRTEVALNENCVQAIVEHGGGGIMVGVA